MRWAAAMAVGLETGVPWIMCKQKDAPDPVVSSLSLFANSYPFQFELLYPNSILSFTLSNFKLADQYMQWDEMWRNF